MSHELPDVERDRRAMEIFSRACGLDFDPRQQLLAELCGEDRVVRERVDAMLAADDSATPAASDAAVDGFVAKQIDTITRTPSSIARPDPAAVDGEYTLLRVIGEGGMGMVYEAEQHHPRRRVAIKAIRPGRISPQMSKRFEYEAQVLARLEHPNIARLYESNTQSDGAHVRAYLAMELVNGVPIDAYCDEKQLPPVERLKLFRRVCDAVAYAHRMGVIHRDLKPANILVNAEGEPKILDFGVARTVGPDSQYLTQVTQNGQLIGTLAYMSPEQVESSTRVDTRADVYSLGVILYRLLAGALPIDVSGDGLIEAARRVLHEPAVRLGRRDKRFRGDLEFIVARALEKLPARRYDSADQLSRELDRYLHGRPVEARGDSSVYLFRKMVRRHRTPVAIGVLLLAMLTVFGIVASIQARRNRQLALDANYSRNVAVDAQARAHERAEALRHLLYFSSIGFAQAAVENNNMQRAYTLLDNCDPSLREWEWFYLHRLTDRSDATMDLAITRPRYASFTTDGTGMAVASLERQVVVRDMNTGIERLREQLPGGTVRVALSRDGAWLAFGGYIDEITLLELATGKRRRLPLPSPSITDDRRRGLRMLQFTSDGRSLISGGTDQHLRLWDTHSAALRRSIPLGEAPPICLQLAEDDSWCAVGDSGGGLQLIDLRSGAIRKTLNAHDSPLWSLALSHDARRLASGDNDGQIVIWDVATGDKVMEISRSDAWTTALSFSPDDQTLAVGRADSVVRLVNLGDGSTRGVLRGHHDAIVHVNWLTGERLHTFSLDGTAKTWNTRAAIQEPTIVTGQPESIGLAFDQAGRKVFAGGSDGTVRSWTVTGSQHINAAEGERLAEHAGHVLEIAVDRSGEQIATASKDGIVHITPVDAPGPPIVMAPGAGGVNAIDFAPDGAYLIIGSDHEISLWDTASGDKLRVLAFPDTPANELRFDHAGGAVYGACADGRLRRWDVESGDILAEVLIDPHGLYDLQLTPDGSAIVVAGDTQTAALIDTNTLQLIHPYVGHAGGVLAVAIHPGGKRLATGGIDGTIRIWDIDSATELIHLRGHRRRIQHLAFSCDGMLIASSSDDGTVKLWDAAPMTPLASATPAE